MRRRRQPICAAASRDFGSFPSDALFVILRRPCQRWHSPTFDLRTHALDSHVAKLGVLLTLLVSRLPLRVIPPFLQLVHVLELNDDQASPRRFTGERNGLATREDATPSLSGSLLGHRRDHLPVLVFIL